MRSGRSSRATREQHSKIGRMAHSGLGRGGTGIPQWVLVGGNVPATVDIDFVNNRGWQQWTSGAAAGFITVSRASQGTNLLPTSASGFAYTTFGNNVARITSGLGLLVEESRTNFLLNSTAPVTQTTASLGTGTYTLWVNGSGTATPSGGTATITGAAAASQGSPNTFTVTVAGTVTVTVSGSLNAFQLELGAFGTSLIVTAGTTATRAADVVTLASPPSFGSSQTSYVSGISYAALNALPSNPQLLSLDDGSTNNQLRMSLGHINGRATVNLTAGGSSIYSSNLSLTNYFSTFVKTAFSSAPGVQTGVVAGGSAVTGSNASSITPTAVTIGYAIGGNNQIDGYIQRIAIWPTIALSSAALQSITSGSGP